MNLIKSFAIGLTTLSLSSCVFASSGSGIFSRKESLVASDNIVTKTIAVGEFSRVNCSIPVDINYSDGRREVTAILPDNVLEVVNFEVRGDELFIECKDYNIRNMREAIIRISAPELHGLTINGSGDFEAPLGFKTSDCAIKINGSGDIQTKNLRADKLRISINGSGDVELSNLNSGDIDINVNGSGDVEMNGRCSSANVRVNGSGDIDIRGLNSDSVSTKVNGSGKVLSGSRAK